MKFYVGSKQTGNYFKNEIRRIFSSNGGFISLAEVKKLFREKIEEDDSQYGWDEDSDIGKKVRVRECKDGWYLYLPMVNAKICFNKKDKTFDEESYKKETIEKTKSKVIANIEPPNIDVCVLETEIFEKLVKAIDNIRLSMDGIGEVIGVNYGYFYRPCIVKAKKSGRKEERQDRNAKFHRWADLSKGVQQVVAIVEFDDGHIEQVQPDRVVFKEE